MHNSAVYAKYPKYRSALILYKLIFIHYFFSKIKNARLDERKLSVHSDKTVPYLANLNEDPMLSYVIFHYFNTDEVTVGSRNSTICLNGLNILERHATIRAIDANKYQLIAAEPGVKIKVNGYNLNG